MVNLPFALSIPVLLLLQGCTTTTARIPVEDHSLATNERFPSVYNAPRVLSEPGQKRVAMAAEREEPVVHSPLQQPLEERADPLREMVRQIEQALQRNEIGRAEMLVERALRIDSGRAGLWHDLAQIRMRQSSWNEVIVLARRSNGLAAGKQGLQQQNWSLIAQAREALGDHAGAQAAWKRSGE